MRAVEPVVAQAGTGLSTSTARPTSLGTASTAVRPAAIWRSTPGDPVQTRDAAGGWGVVLGRCMWQPRVDRSGRTQSSHLSPSPCSSRCSWRRRYCRCWTN